MTRMYDWQELKYRLYMIRRQLTVLALLVLVLIGIYWFVPKENMLTMMATQKKNVPPTAQAIRTGEAPIPAFSTTTKEKLAAHKGFQALVSYTDNGFEPGLTTLKQGETVRFTNNSSEPLWVAADVFAGAIYPRTMQTCGSSDLDSCAPIQPMDFWEFTFDAAGEWELVNNLEKTKSASVKVEVR